MSLPEPDPLFDAYAEGYEEALERGLSLTGESREHYARRRLDWLAHCLGRLGVWPRRILDFGCGTGETVPLLGARFDAERVVGVDRSAKSLARAVERFGGGRWQFLLPDDASLGSGGFDLIYTNGVFHHIDPGGRPAVVAQMKDWLRPGGWLALWENNPLNPGTRWVMSRVPFDRDAVLLSAWAARRLVSEAGFRVARTDHWFLFPRVLRWLRPFERCICRLPLGGQYQVLACWSRPEECLASPPPIVRR